MTQEEFLELLGKGQPDADKDLIAAVEKVLKEGVPDESAEHSDVTDVLADAYDEIEHYGVDGMKWGVQNGPPYPLSRSKRAKLRKQDKARIVLDNIDDLSLDEIRSLISRIELEEKLEKMTRDDKEKGKSYINRILSKSGDAIIDRVVPAATEFAFKQMIQNVAGEDVVKDMFPKKK